MKKDDEPKQSLRGDNVKSDIQIHSIINKIQSAEKRLRSIFNMDRIEKIREIGEKIQHTIVELSKIDWEAVVESLSKYSKDIVQFSNEISKDEIFVNFIYYDKIPLATYEEHLDKEVLLAWMKKNVDDVVTAIANKEYMEKHKILLTQSLKAYNAGDKEIAVLGILPAIEYFISNWLKSQSNGGRFDHENPTTAPWLKEDLKKIYQDAPTLSAEDALLGHYFEYKALEGAYKIFVYKKSKSKTPQSKTPRNSLVHGSFDYSKLVDFDYVRLVYLLNSLLSLHNVKIKEEK